jgi:hypothetical protein
MFKEIKLLSRLAKEVRYTNFEMISLESKVGRNLLKCLGKSNYLHEQSLEKTAPGYAV